MFSDSPELIERFQIFTPSEAHKKLLRDLARDLKVIESRLISRNLVAPFPGTNARKQEGKLVEKRSRGSSQKEERKKKRKLIATEEESPRSKTKEDAEKDKEGKERAPKRARPSRKLKDSEGTLPQPESESHGFYRWSNLTRFLGEAFDLSRLDFDKLQRVDISYVLLPPAVSNLAIVGIELLTLF